jgi:3-hydroxyacyl-[acyl-carrier-protein] dehydratase
LFLLSIPDAGRIAFTIERPTTYFTETMADSALNQGGPATQSPNSSKAFTAEDESALREALKRCSSATLESALQFRKNHDATHVPVVVIGVIERFVEPGLRPKLHASDDDLRMVEDLGIDSLTMMEIVILVEDVLQMQINNDELRNLRTVGDVKTFIDCKARGLPPPKPTRHLPIEQIASVMPIQPPFLFLNEASVNNQGAQGKYKITGQEFFLQGHFKDNPVMPASIMIEAIGQLAVLALLEGVIPVDEGKVVDPKTIFFTSSEGVRCHRICRPGDVLTISVKPKRAKMPLATFEGSIRVGQEKAVMAEEITLTYGFMDAVVVQTPAIQQAAVAPTPIEAPKATDPLEATVNS